MNGYSSPQMMMAKPKQGKTFLRDNLGLGLGLRFFLSYTNTNFYMIINIILIFDCFHDIIIYIV